MKVYLNKKEITNFDSDKDTIEFVEGVLTGKDSDFPYVDSDILDFELEGQGLIRVDLTDLNSQGKLTIFE